MTGAELKTLRESLGLPVRWLANVAEVKERTINYWENGVFQIPEDVELLLLEINNLLNAQVTEAMRHFDSAALTRSGGAGKVVLLRYKTNEDLWTFQPGFKNLMLPASCHAMLLSRLKERMNERGAAVQIVYMNIREYFKWLGERTDDAALRSEWAVYVETLRDQSHRL